MVPVESIRCILIDDHLEEHEIFGLAIRETGLGVICHYYLWADEAFTNLYHHIGPAPKLIFLDINIPRMNGIDFLRKIKAIPHLKHIPVYMYSITDLPEHLDLAMELGADGYIVKPETRAELVQVLTKTFTDYLPGNVKR